MSTTGAEDDDTPVAIAPPRQLPPYVHQYRRPMSDTNCPKVTQEVCSVEERQLRRFFKCTKFCLTSGQKSGQCFATRHTAASFERHLRSTHPKQQFYCCYCYPTISADKKKIEDVRDWQELIQHMVRDHQHRTYQCNLCLYRAVTAEHVNLHQSLIHPDIYETSVNTTRQLGGKACRILQCPPADIVDPAADRVALGTPVHHWLRWKTRRRNNKPPLQRHHQCLYCEFADESQDKVRDHVCQTHPDYYLLYYTCDTDIAATDPRTPPVAQQLSEIDIFQSNQSKPGIQVNRISSTETDQMSSARDLEAGTEELKFKKNKERKSHVQSSQQSRNSGLSNRVTDTVPAIPVSKYINRGAQGAAATAIALSGRTRKPMPKSKTPQGIQDLAQQKAEMERRLEQKSRLEQQRCNQYKSDDSDSDDNRRRRPPPPPPAPRQQRPPPPPRVVAAPPKPQPRPAITPRPAAGRQVPPAAAQLIKSPPKHWLCRLCTGDRREVRTADRYDHIRRYHLRRLKNRTVYNALYCLHCGEFVATEVVEVLTHQRSCPKKPHGLDAATQTCIKLLVPDDRTPDEIAKANRVGTAAAAAAEPKSKQKPTSSDPKPTPKPKPAASEPLTPKHKPKPFITEGRSPPPRESVKVKPKPISLLSTSSSGSGWSSSDDNDPRPSTSRSAPQRKRHKSGSLSPPQRKRQASGSLSPRKRCSQRPETAPPEVKKYLRLDNEPKRSFNRRGSDDEFINDDPDSDVDIDAIKRDTGRHRKTTTIDVASSDEDKDYDITKDLETKFVCFFCHKVRRGYKKAVNHLETHFPDIGDSTGDYNDSITVKTWFKRFLERQADGRLFIELTGDDNTRGRYHCPVCVKLATLRDTAAKPFERFNLYKSHVYQHSRWAPVQCLLCLPNHKWLPNHDHDIAQHLNEHHFQSLSDSGSDHLGLLRGNKVWHGFSAGARQALIDQEFVAFSRHEIIDTQIERFLKAAVDDNEDYLRSVHMPEEVQDMVPALPLSRLPAINYEDEESVRDWMAATVPGYTRQRIVPSGVVLDERELSSGPEDLGDVYAVDDEVSPEVVPEVIAVEVEEQPKRKRKRKRISLLNSSEEENSDLEDVKPVLSDESDCQIVDVVTSSTPAAVRVSKPKATVNGHNSGTNGHQRSPPSAASGDNSVAADGDEEQADEELIATILQRTKQELIQTLKKRKKSDK